MDIMMPENGRLSNLSMNPRRCGKTFPYTLLTAKGYERRSRKRPLKSGAER
jgi:hypothetical protein